MARVAGAQGPNARAGWGAAQAVKLLLRGGAAVPVVGANLVALIFQDRTAHIMLWPYARPPHTAAPPTAHHCVRVDCVEPLEWRVEPALRPRKQAAHAPLALNFLALRAPCGPIVTR